MSEKWEAARKKFQLWLRVSKRSDLWAILRSADGRDFRKEIDRACKAFELDSTNQLDRELLLGVFADIHFPAPGALFKSRRKKWSPHLVDQLNRDANRIRLLNPTISFAELAGQMLDIWPYRYKIFSQSTLAQNLTRHLRQTK